MSAFGDNARAAEKTPAATAADIYKEADQARLAQDYATCIKKAEEAYALFPQAQIRGLQGTCENALDRFEEAATHLAYYFDNTTGEPPDEFRKAFVRSQGRTTKVTIDCNPAGLEVTVDGKPIGTAPITVYLSPGDRVFVATRPGGGTKEERRPLVAGTKITVRLDLGETGTVEGPKPGEPLPMWPAVVGFSVAGAGILLGGGMSIASAVRSGQAADVSRGCAQGGYSDCITEGQSISDEADTFGNVGIAGFAVGGAALLFAIPYAAVAGSSSSSDDVSFVPVLSPDFSGGLLRARF